MGEGIFRFIHKSNACITQGGKKQAGNFGIDYRPDAIENGHKQHGEQDPRFGIPYQAEYVKQPREKSTEQLLQIAGNIAESFR